VRQTLKPTFFQPRTCFAVLLSLLLLLLFRSSLKELIALSLKSDHYTHVLFVPFVSAVLVYLHRRNIFVNVHYSLAAALVLFLFAIMCFAFRHAVGFVSDQSLPLSLTILSALVFLWADFMLCFGTAVFRNALFSLLLLLLVVPVPDPWLELLEQSLQIASADIADLIFKATGAPIAREGMFFVLPGITIEVAKQCSGIRSFISFFISGLVAAHLLLRSPWKKALLCVVIVPIVVVLKNGLRIATLSLLAAYVDRDILTSWIHRYGGVIFSVLAIVLITPVLWLLHRSDEKHRQLAPLPDPSQ
jgi:exosortase